MAENSQVNGGATTVTPIVENSDRASRQGRRGYYRWTICALLFFATTINYLDRVVISLLGPNIKDMFVQNMVSPVRVQADFQTLSPVQAQAFSAEIQSYIVTQGKARETATVSAAAQPVLKKYQGESEQQFARVTMAFQAAYAIGLLLAGRFMDWIGTRWGLSLAVAFWSLAGMGHAFARSFTGFVTARFGLGLAEAGNFPAAIKTVAEWFPKRERALATGIFNAGSNIGAVVAPILVPWLAITYGWREAFVVTGLVGFVWMFFWLALYEHPRRQRRLGAAELQYIESDPPDTQAARKIGWLEIVSHRQAWAFSLGKLMTDPIWWFFLFWTPSFFKAKFGVGLDKISLPMIVIYLAADVGSIAGGWLSSTLIKHGWTVNRARKTALLTCALCVLPVWIAAKAENPWVAVGFISLALAAHQGWSANLFTVVSDTFPRFAVGSVVGFGGMCGAVGGLLVSEFVGRLLKETGMYMPMFIVASCAYLSALLVIHLLVPRLDPADLDDAKK